MRQLAILNKNRKRVHVAIMRKSWGLTAKILAGEKTIESRWYKNRHRPWDRINTGDVIYFKDSGEPVTARAKVDKVLQFGNMTPRKAREILFQYADSLGIEHGKAEEFYKMFRDKRFCVLIFLKNAEEIPPFNVDKSGFGSQAAWLIVEDVDKIKKGL